MKKQVIPVITIILIILVLISLLMVFGFNKKSKATDKLYLSLRPANFVDNVPNIVYKNFNEDLIIVLKTSEVPNDLNLPSSIKSEDEKDIPITGATSYVLKSDVAKYGVSESKLFGIALKNFEKLEMPLNVVYQDNSSKPNIASPKYEDSYGYGEDIVQSNLISQKSLGLLKEQLGDEFYVTMSNYETFMAFRKDLEEGHWKIIKNITLEDYNNGSHPLSYKLYLYSNGKLTPVE